MDRYWYWLTPLVLALTMVLAAGCGMEETEEAPEVTFAATAPGPQYDMPLPEGSTGVVTEVTGGFLAGSLETLSRQDARDLLQGDRALRGHLRGYRDRTAQLRHGVDAIWARYPGRTVGLFWGEAAQAAWPLGESVGLRTTLHVRLGGLGAVELPLRFQAPGLSPAPLNSDGLIVGVVVARDVPPTLGQVDAALWTLEEGVDRHLPWWSWGGLQRLSDDVVGLDLVLCDVGVAPDARDRIRWDGAILDLDISHGTPGEAPPARAMDTRASWTYVLDDGILRGWRRGALQWETPVCGAVLAGLDGDDLRLVVIGGGSVEVVDADTGAIEARFVRGWSDVPGLAEALAGLDTDCRDRDALLASPLGEVLSAAWADEAQRAAARGWTPEAVWWDGWAVFFSDLPY